MAAIDEEARRQLAQQIKLEQSLLKDVKSINKAMVRDAIKKMANDGEILNAEIYQDNFQAALSNQYDLVNHDFSGVVTDKLTNEPTVQEEDVIAAALALWFFTRAPTQAKIITQGNQNDINAGVQFALKQKEIAASEGRPISQRETAVLAGSKMSQRLNGRAGGIALTETGSAAEVIKQTETDVMLGNDPSIETPSPRKALATKEWVTMGDEAVRPWHQAADGQIVNASGTYTVGPDLMRFPKDASLGAGPANIVNCRCQSIPNTAQIDEARESGEFLSPSAFDTEINF